VIRKNSVEPESIHVTLDGLEGHFIVNGGIFVAGGTGKNSAS
jgi:hypothetical protein